MTTEMKAKKTTSPTVNDNKTVFAPLGKYAVVAVIMASIIVTTVIMLDKQLNTVEEQIAAIENEVAEMHITDSKTGNTTNTEQAAEVIASAPEANKTETTKETEITAQEEAAATPTPVATQTTETPTADVLVAIESTPVTDTKPKEVAAIETVETVTAVKSRQTELEMDHNTRIEAYKLEQKQRMAEMFARIRSLETKQLDQYKVNQDEQITRLRAQLVSQQQIIDRLVLRKKELFELRAANIQKNQARREQVLNRI